MKQFVQKRSSFVSTTLKIFASLLLLFLFVSCSFVQNPPVASVQVKNTGGKRAVAGSGPRPEPGSVISRNAPAFASAGYYPASQANDDSYDTVWRSQGVPAWLAYDLSNVPVVQRHKVLIVWYNESTNYDHTIINNYAYNLPQDYTIEANAAAGGTSAPTTGWVKLVGVQGNHYHSRQYIVDMTGYNWIRIYVTAVDGAPENEDVSLNMDVYDVHSGIPDDWIFYGDSITAGAMGHETLNGVVSFAQLIHAQVPTDFPIQESGGIGYLTTQDALQYLPTWLSLFPGKYVGLSYGTNDANGCVNPDTVYQNYVTLIEDVTQAGKIPIIPHIPWGATTNIQNCGPLINAKIDALYQTFPQVIKGPDLWTFFANHQNLISQDNIHPTDAGFGAYRQLWAETMLAEVYK